MKCLKCHKPMTKNGFTKTGKQRYRCKKCGASTIEGKQPAKTKSERDAKYYASLAPEQKAERQRRNTELQRKRRAAKKPEK